VKGKGNFRLLIIGDNWQAIVYKVYYPLFTETEKSKNELKPGSNILDTINLTSEDNEVFETLLEHGDLKITRIVTLESFSEPGKWYDQELDEWVVLLQGSAVLEFKGDKKVDLKAGDHLLIPAHKTHRVKQSSKIEKCIWLTIHGKLK